MFMKIISKCILNFDISSPTNPFLEFHGFTKGRLDGRLYLLRKGPQTRDFFGPGGQSFRPDVESSTHDEPRNRSILFSVQQRQNVFHLLNVIWILCVSRSFRNSLLTFYLHNSDFPRRLNNKTERDSIQSQYAEVAFYRYIEIKWCHFTWKEDSAAKTDPQYIG